MIQLALKFIRALTAEKTENKAIRREKGGLNTKIHAIADDLGSPVVFLRSPGNEHDSVHAVELMEMTDITGDKRPKKIP